MEETERQSIRTVGKEQLRVLHRRVELRPRVAKAALPRTDHGHDVHPGLPFGHGQGPQRGREPAVEQVAVQLHPVRSGPVGLDHIVRAAAADLQQYPFLLHDSPAFHLFSAPL